VISAVIDSEALDNGLVPVHHQQQSPSIDKNEACNWSNQLNLKRHSTEQTVQEINDQEMDPNGSICSEIVRIEQSVHEEDIKKSEDTLGKVANFVRVCILLNYFSEFLEKKLSFCCFAFEKKSFSKFRKILLALKKFYKFLLWI
jgi:uncharacterized membrane protein YcgQ (UPF0703/DUF1980 family)